MAGQEPGKKKALATPRLHDRSPTAFNVRGQLPVKSVQSRATSCDLVPSRALLTKSGSASSGRAIDTMSACPDASS